MLDEYTCLSERTLRYGRNVMFISFISFAVWAFDANLETANIVGIKLDKPVFILWAMLIIHIYFLLVFFYLMRGDTNRWKRECLNRGFPIGFLTVIKTKQLSNIENEKNIYDDIVINYKRNKYIDSYPPIICGLLGLGFIISKIASMSSLTD